jgi:hypothetical protein
LSMAIWNEIVSIMQGHILPWEVYSPVTRPNPGIFFSCLE